MKYYAYDSLINIALGINDVLKFNKEQRDDINNFASVMERRRIRLYHLMFYASSRLATLYFRCEPYIVGLNDDIYLYEKAMIYDINKWDEKNKDVDPAIFSRRQLLINVYHISEKYVDDMLSQVNSYEVQRAEENIGKVYCREKEDGLEIKY